MWLHGGQSMAAGVWGGRSHCNHSQEAQLIFLRGKVKSWVHVYWWPGHSHVKDPRQAQGNSQVFPWFMCRHWQYVQKVLTTTSSRGMLTAWDCFPLETYGGQLYVTPSSVVYSKCPKCTSVSTLLDPSFTVHICLCVCPCFVPPWPQSGFQDLATHGSQHFLVSISSRMPAQGMVPSKISIGLLTWVSLI